LSTLPCRQHASAAIPPGHLRRFPDRGYARRSRSVST
jgi:hypothetical protein